MSGIRLFIALSFLIAGLESELQASASQLNPADFICSSQLDGITSPLHKTSLHKMTKVATEMDLWILSARVIELTPQLTGSSGYMESPYQYLRFMSRDSFRRSGNSPPRKA